MTGVEILVRENIKYLGVIMDRTLSFADHFRMVLAKAEGVIAALSRLMPNLRGPGKRRRRLYVFVVRSILIYGAPIWADALSRNRRLRVEVGRLMRRIALRVISAY